MMKKIYVTPSINIVQLSSKDVITTSGLTVNGTQTKSKFTNFNADKFKDIEF